ncbi:Na+-translocating ferredoxin:NAD+ oxidoreductase RnfC subunit [Bradyrhizobium sp. S3.9.2]|uniref:hypothetical protein n=1 Tax=Bradyrhizobium sp. S3.9.2 TaxID=3156432 RepID=UPI00339B03EB
MGNEENYERMWQMRQENEQRREELQQQRREREYLEEMGQPVEDRVARWRREAEEQTARQQRAVRERRRSERRAEPVNLDLRIAEAIAEERRFMVEVIGETVAEMAERQTRAIADAVRPLLHELSELKIAHADAKVAIAELRLQQSGGSTIDPPVLPLRDRPN